MCEIPQIAPLTYYDFKVTQNNPEPQSVRKKGLRYFTSRYGGREPETSRNMAR